MASLLRHRLLWSIFGPKTLLPQVSPRREAVLLWRTVPQSTVEKWSRCQMKCFRIECSMTHTWFVTLGTLQKSGVFARRPVSTVFLSGNVQWKQRLNKGCEPLRVFMYVLCLCQTSTSTSCRLEVMRESLAMIWFLGLQTMQEQIHPGLPLAWLSSSFKKIVCWLQGKNCKPKRSFFMFPFLSFFQKRW